MARKTHLCKTCGQPAARPGQEYERETYAYDGQVYDWVTCAECNAIRNEVAEVCDTGEGVTPEDYEAWADETQYEPTIWAGPARDFLRRLHSGEADS